MSDGVRIVQTHSKKQYQISEHALLEQRKKHDINKMVRLSLDITRYMINDYTTLKVV